MFKTTWKKLEEEKPVIYVRYEDVVRLVENAPNPQVSINGLKNLDIFTEAPHVGPSHRAPSFGSD